MKCVKTDLVLVKRNKWVWQELGIVNRSCQENWPERSLESGHGILQTSIFNCPKLDL